MSSTSSSRKRTDLSVRDKQNILKQYDEKLKSLSQREAAANLGIPQSTLSGILKNREKIVCVAANRKRKREGKSQTVDEALLVWFKQASSMNAPINRSILMQKANDLAEKMCEPFTATDGWLTRWKERHGIVFKKLHGEKQDSDLNAATDWAGTTWKTITETYTPDAIYNLDETGLYYRATPDQCMVFKSSIASAGKKMKDRITVVFTCNMSGLDKLKPLVIGKSKAPRCFKKVKNLPVDYTSNKNAWMTASIFENYLREWDSKLQNQKKKIALILDNCTAHPNLTFKNIQLFFLPPNTTSIIQPLDQGIIKTFKTYYRTDMRKTIIDLIDYGKGTSSEIAKKISLLDALHMTAKSWNMVSASCISNCFNRLGKCAPQVGLNEQLLECEKPSDMPEEEFDNWVEIDNAAPVGEIMTDEDIAQSVIQNFQETDEKNDDNEDDEEPEREPVTKKKVRESLLNIRRALEECGAGIDEYKNLYNLESFINKTIDGRSKQTKISDFFM